MSNAKKIIPSDYVTEYVATTLDAPKALMITCQRSMCLDAAHEIEMQEEIATTMMLNGEDAALSDGFFSRVLEQISQKTAPQKQPPKTPLKKAALNRENLNKADGPKPVQIANDLTPKSPLMNKLPKPLADFMGEKAIHWSFLASGIESMPLWFGERGERLSLLKIKGGFPMPGHDHIGEAWSLVLSGSYYVDSTQYSRGDLHVQDEHYTHIPFVYPGKDCICLMLNEAPVNPMKLLDEVLKPLSRARI